MEFGQKFVKLIVTIFFGLDFFKFSGSLCIHQDIYLCLLRSRDRDRLARSRSATLWAKNICLSNSFLLFFLSFFSSFSRFSSFFRFFFFSFFFFLEDDFDLFLSSSAPLGPPSSGALSSLSVEVRRSSSLSEISSNFSEAALSSS